MFAEDGEVTRARLDAHVEDVDAFVGAASKTTRWGLRLALLLVRLSPILLLLRFRTLERVPVAERVTVLAALERSSRAAMSLAFIGWRTIMTLLFYEDESELSALGYRAERQRYKRALPIHAGTREALPTPLESGVRLRDPDETPLPRRLDDPLEPVRERANNRDVA